ncbi:hypothetical protein NYP83_10625 [Erwinia pyrifoliae]|uniref:hypothetical protein n=1 Tax=Erwinia pyrifoliae TaxID=79967 RepID=UPI0021D7C06A|nr:hypothetical protein [Erwinia pyrifoliae]MCU8587346.1 hypothetical protein [Erwinia pyrifoliae]
MKMNVTSTSQSTSTTSLTPVPEESSSVKSTLEVINYFENLPVELLEKVASFSGGSYGELRWTCSFFRDRLESISSIANKFRGNNVPQTEQQKNEYLLLYSAMKEKASPQTVAALANQKNGFTDKEISTWAMTCRYPGVFEVVDPIKKIFNDMSPQLTVAHGYFDSQHSLTLRLYEQNLNERDISEIFNQADSLFQANKDDAGLVLASKMSALWDHLVELRAADKTFKISHKVLARLRDRYSSMFLAGGTINTVTPPSSGIIKMDKVLNAPFGRLIENYLLHQMVLAMIMNPPGRIIT